jgi:hypothetical protein
MFYAVLTGCAGGAPVPLTPGTYYVSIALSRSGSESAARNQAEENANNYCDKDGRKTEILDSKIIDAEGAAGPSLDLIFRCTEVAGDAPA